MKADWKWYGNAGHFICAQWCEFHLCTEVGAFLVSTVGQYMPPESVREILAQSRGVSLEGKGDARLADYHKKIGYEKLGFERTFETMVFRIGADRCTRSDCNCGLPDFYVEELEMIPYNQAGDANTGHLAMCEKYDNLPVQRGNSCGGLTAPASAPREK